jgi:plastocyanin
VLNRLSPKDVHAVAVIAISSCACLDLPLAAATQRIALSARRPSTWSAESGRGHVVSPWDRGTALFVQQRRREGVRARGAADRFAPAWPREGLHMRHGKHAWLASLLPVLLVTAIVAGAGTLPATAAVAKAKVKHVTIQNFNFLPRTITIKAGTKVVWKNTDGFDHHLASTNSIKTTAKITSQFSSGLLSSGKTFSFTYKKKGTFYYECTIHFAMKSMHGKVIVK